MNCTQVKIWGEIILQSAYHKCPPLPTRDYSEIVFLSIELAAREITECKPRLKKASSTEKELEPPLLRSGPTTPDYSHKCEQLTNKLHGERVQRANKRVHASLILGQGVKKALDAHSHLTKSPIALIDAHDKASTSPKDSGTIMSNTLPKLGRGMDYSVALWWSNLF